MTQLFKFMQVHENEEDQAVSLVKDDKHYLSLLYTREGKKKTREYQVFQPPLSHSIQK